MLLIISINSLFAQEVVKSGMVNINPNRDGEPWIAGGLRERTEAELIKLHNTPKFSPQIPLRANRLPAMVNNATHKAFRPIFRQTGNCCAQASGIAYHLTYELNLLRGSSANTPENQLPTHYTWTLVNWGGNYGSLYTEGWDMVIDNGCPNIPDYGSIDANGDCTFWMSGYDRYKRAMKNRVKSYQTIDLTKANGIDNLKQWIFDHGRGDKTGGLANFSVYSNGATIKKLTGNTEEKGKYVVTKWGKTGPHAMTIVGYNDNIRYDYNGDGKYTNNIDINGDGKVDVRDWENGAFIFANSWGTGWANNGFCYMMYKVCAEPKTNGGLKEDNLVHILNVEDRAAPGLTLRVKLKHSSRENLRIKLGYSPDDKGYISVYSKEFKMFNYYTGNNNIRGKRAKYDDALEVELDIDDFYDKMVDGKGKFFIMIESDKGKGRIIEATVTDNIRDKKYSADYNTRTEFTLLNTYPIPLNSNASLLTDEYPFAINHASSINKLRISHVKLAGIDNKSEASNYSNFISKVANLTKGNSHNIEITYGHNQNPTISSNITVWIDWNQNKDLEFSEIASLGYYNKSVNTLSKKITVPANAKEGKTLMRIRTSYEDNTRPWGDIYNEGEVEDYTINITSETTILPEVKFTANKTVITQDELVQFNSTVEADNYNWIFKGGSPETSAKQNPNIKYSKPGMYSVKLTVTKNGVSNTKTIDNYITVKKKDLSGKPHVDFTADKTTIIQGESVQFTSLSDSDVDRHMWIFTEGTPKTSMQQNPVVTYNTPGEHRVILTVFRNGIPNSKKILRYITVKEKTSPVKPKVDFMVNKTVITQGESVQFSSMYEADNYKWEFQGATPNTSVTKIADVIYNTPGIYSVTLTVTNSGELNKKTALNLITVKKRPDPVKPLVDFSADKRVITEGETVQFNNLSDTEADSYKWIFNGAANETSDKKNPAVTYNTHGIYSVTITVTKNGISNTKKSDNYITVKERNTDPTNIVLSNNIISGNGSAGLVIGYLKAVDANKNDTHIFEISEDDNNAFVIDRNILLLKRDITNNIKREYVIQIKVTDNNGGEYNKQFKIEQIATAIDNLNNDNITIYPNPVTGNSIYIKADIVINKIEIYNMSGHKLLSETQQENSKSIKIDMPKIYSGTYFIQIFGKNRTITKKIIFR